MLKGMYTIRADAKTHSYTLHGESKLEVSTRFLTPELGNPQKRGPKDCRNQRGWRTPGEHHALNQISTYGFIEIAVANMGPEGVYISLHQVLCI